MAAWLEVTRADVTPQRVRLPSSLSPSPSCRVGYLKWQGSMQNRSGMCDGTLDGATGAGCPS